MAFPKCEVCLMVECLAKIHGRVFKLIRVRELATTHRLEQVRSVRILEQRAIWMRKICFDGIEVIAEIHEETLRPLLGGFDSEPLYTGLYNPRGAPTPDDFTLDMKV